MKKDFSELIFILFIAFIFAAGCFIASCEHKNSEKNYNNGICTECGGEYHFSSAQHIKNSGDKYYYTCKDCGHTIVTFTIKK